MQEYQEHEARDAFPIPWEDGYVHPGYLRNRRSMRRRQNILNAPLMGCPSLVVPWLLAMGSQRRTAYEEGAHGEQPITG